jgi:hypothetical protein
VTPVQLEAKLHDLYGRLRHVSECLAEVRTTIREDHPRPGETVLVDIIGDAVDDLLGSLAEAEEATLGAAQALDYPVRMDRARDSLATAQRLVHLVNQRFVSDLKDYEHIAALLRLGRERGRDWSAWARSVHEGLDRCQVPLADLYQALFECWLELAERPVEVTSTHESASLRHTGGG